MIQEYLFTGDEQKEAVKNYCPEKVQKEIQEIENSDCWTVTYSAPGENRETAILLSNINEFVIEHFHPTILTNESSAYFNKALFPHINEFERKLRKFLYLKSALNKDNDSSKNIKDLEQKDLGQIFELLFSDSNFVNEARKMIHAKSWQFTKDEIILSLQELTEHTLWDDLIGVDSVPSLRKSFPSLRTFRNDVMHAHNINAKTYKVALSLVKEINSQLDLEIGKIIKQKEINAELSENNSYNAALSSALHSMSIAHSVAHAALAKSSVQAILSQIEALSLLKVVPSELSSQISELYKMAKSSSTPYQRLIPQNNSTKESEAPTDEQDEI